MNRVVGFTTTIPVEVLFAAGYTPCDLNNIFISDKNPMRFIERAEKDGFPRSMCNWIKGIYGVVVEQGIETVITVLEGDCSNTRILAEILFHKGIEVVPFLYPFDRDEAILGREIEKLMARFSVDRSSLADIEAGIEKVRKDLDVIDRMTWRERKVSGQENHLWLVRASDMLGDYRSYGRMTDDFINEAKTRQVIEGVPIGYIGVPPIVTNLYEFIEEVGGHVTYNETQRQFALPYFSTGIIERYRKYTYPYSIFVRIDDIKAQVKKRGLRGIIHYVQAFCYRGMEDVILRDILGVPVMTIEGDLPRPLDGRTKLRIEAFMEMLKERGCGANQEILHEP